MSEMEPRLRADLEWDILDRLHKSLRCANLTGKALADELGLHRNTVNNYLSGRTAIDRRTLIAWSLRTGVPFKWLETGVIPEEPEDPTEVRHTRLERVTH